MTKLIFIEGVSGAGKSTAAKALAEKLCEKGFNAAKYLEFDIANPIDFCCTAYLSADDYKKLLNKYAEYVDLIGEHTIVADDARLVRYYDGKTPLFSEPLLSKLKDHEFCWKPTKLIPLAEYCRVMETVWRNFAQSVDGLPDYIIFDGSLLHHPINDMLRNYNAPLQDVSAHIEKLLDAVQTLNPMVFYYNPESVRDSLINARTSRHERAATEEYVTFWENRNRVDRAVLANMRIVPHILNIPLGGWEEAFDEMLNTIVRNEGSVMNTICGNDELGLRPLLDNSADYALLHKWLSNPDICEYYEGRTKLFTMAGIKDKFMERAKGIDPQRVRVGIIQAQGKPIGFLQFYPTILSDYDACANIAEYKYHSPYGMDIVIGDTNYWNKGFGTAIMRQTMQFLFKREGADLILIDPQTWNKRAIRSYEKCGFTPLLVAKDRETQDGEPRDCLIMACAAISFEP